MVRTRLRLRRASLSPVRRAPQSTDTAEGLLESCAIKGARVGTDVKACVDTDLDSCEVGKDI